MAVKISLAGCSLVSTKSSENIEQPNSLTLSSFHGILNHETTNPITAAKSKITKAN